YPAHNRDRCPTPTTGVIAVPVALTADQAALAETVAGFADRYAAREYTRKHTDRLKQGNLPEFWPELVALGLTGVHLPETVGGQGGTLDELAVVVAESGRALLPGPLLPTAVAGAVLADAGESAGTALRRIAEG